MTDRWARCAGFPAYEASTGGAIRQRHTRRVLSAYVSDKGYLIVNVQAAGGWYRRAVHGLVWRAFRGPVPNGLTVDHRDRARGNPRLSNLRLATRAQQMANSDALGGSSPYKGVTWCAARNKWLGQIKVQGVNHFLGRSSSQIKLARMYDRVARRHFGKFAVTNFKGKSHV